MRIDTIFEYLRFSIDDSLTQFYPKEELDWEQLYNFAKKQSMIGVMFRGIEKMPSNQKPQRRLMVKWYGETDVIKNMNQKVNDAAVQISRQFSEDGFLNCVLKGQGNALMYPVPELRNPGDVDLWVLADRGAIYKYVRKSHPDTEMLYHHLECPMENGITVEVHFFPMFLNNPFYNRRFQKWMQQEGQEQCNNRIKVAVGEFSRPTDSFNRVYQLAHIRHHFFDEGVGIRQLMDYYYLLKRGCSETEKQECVALLKRFGLYGFAKAVMYVEQKIFGLEDTLLLTEPDAKFGQMLMEEVVITGNFGREDSRFGDLKKTSRVNRLASLFKKNFQFLLYFPDEVIFGLLFRMWQPVWRAWANFKYSR